MLNVDVLKEFIFDCKIRKLSERTIKGYNNNCLRFFSYVKTQYQVNELEQIYTNVINDYIAYLSKLGRKETYINSIIKCLRAFFTYCVNEGYVAELRNPMKKVKLQKCDQTMIFTFTDDEVIEMVKYYRGAKFLEVRNKTIMTFLFDIGIRNNELCNLKLTDIKDTYISIMGKGKKVRVVPISPILNKQLIKYLRVRNFYIQDKFGYDTQYLFLSQKGKKLTVETIERVVLDCGSNVKVRNGIRISPHTCRHYYAQAQLRNGCDLYTLSKLLGHSNPNITKIYLRSMQNDDFIDMALPTSPLMNL